MTAESSSRKKNPVLWMRRTWELERNPFPQGGIASLAREDNRENGRLFRPEVQADKIPEAVDKFVVGAAYSGLKFGYLWSVAGSASEDYRGFGKSSMLQYLVEETNKDFGHTLLAQAGFSDEEADEAAICAMLASFDKGVNTSLAAVFLQATEYACRYKNPATKHEAEGKTLAERLHERLIAKLGDDDPTVLADAVQRVSDSIRGRTLGPPLDDFVQLLCAGDATALGRYVSQVKSGARTRVGAANFLATFLLFAKAAGVPHVLLGCDQLEDFAATTTSKQKRALETERFRDFVLELMPMADMLTIVVTMHPRAELAISEMWRLADLPSMAWHLEENEGHVVVLREVDTVEQTRALLRPYLEEARTKSPTNGEWAPFTDESFEALLDRSDGKPRDLLRKAHALVERAARENWPEIDGDATRRVLDSLALPDDDNEDDDSWTATTSTRSLEETW
jgi:hypothetical protein